MLLRSYHVATLNSTLRGEFYFNADSSIARLDWRRETPTVTQGSDSYSYDANGKVTDMVKTITGLADERIVYRFENDKIFISEHFFNGERLSYLIYDFDHNGRLVHSEENNKVIGSGGHARGKEFEYIYNDDGNLSQIKQYSFNESTAQLSLESVQTFSNFTNALNPLQPIDPLPNIVFQKNLPATLTIESNGVVKTYTYKYTFRPDGYPATRISFENNVSVETLTYEY